MSNQPSQHSDHAAKPDQWHIFLKLADTLSTQFSVKSLLDLVSQVFEHDIPCQVSIWLAPVLSPLLKAEDIQAAAPLVGERTPIMELAYREKKLSPHINSIFVEDNLPKTLAIPLVANGDIYGVVQLDKTSQNHFSPAEVEFCLALASQVSLALASLQQRSYTEYIQHTSTFLTIAEEISKSILSTLDPDNLVNSFLSLLHQSFDYPRVDLYITRNNEHQVFKRVGISQDGISLDPACHVDQASTPVSWSISHLEPVIINTRAAGENFFSLPPADNYASQMVVPLVSGELLMGVVALYGRTDGMFGPASLKGLHMLAQNLTVALRNAKVFHSEQSKRALIDRLQHTVGSLSIDISLDDILQLLLNELEKSLPVDGSAIWMEENLVDAEGLGAYTSFPRLVAFHTRDLGSENPGQELNPAGNLAFDAYFDKTNDEANLYSAYPWMAEIIASSAALGRSTTEYIEPIGEALLLTGEYSVAGVALKIKGQASGLIIVVHHSADHYEDDALSLLDVFADYASITIENTRLYAAAHDQAWISTVLLQIAEATQAISNIDELLDTAVSILPGLIGIQACTIFLWDQSVEAFSPRASSGFDELQAERLSTLEVYPGSIKAFDDMSHETQPVIFSNDNLPDEVALSVFPTYDLQKDLLVLFPLSTQNNLCGAILIDFTGSGLSIDSSQAVWDEKYALIEGAARQTAAAIENLQLIKAQEEEAYISNALLQVAQAIVSNKKLDEILESIVRITPILVGVKRCIIYLWDTKEKSFCQSENYGFSRPDLTMLGEEIKAGEFPFLAAVQSSNHIIYYPLSTVTTPGSWAEITAEEYFEIATSEAYSDETTPIQLDSRTLINRDRLLFGFPLSVKGEVMGVMLIEEEEQAKGPPSLHIREKRIEIVKGITQQAAIAIQNERLQQEAVNSERMARELQLAREIQTAFLPDHVPNLPGWDLAVRWQPARQVAGDFYDILQLEDNQVGLVIADVADKGMPAALFMTLIRTLVRAAAKEEPSPAAVLRQVNDLLLPDSKHSLFVTVFYGLICLDSGRLTYANAGHNPPVIKRANQAGLQELGRTSMALGIFNNIEIDECDFILDPGDWMLLYTDGVTEAFSPGGEMYGTAKLNDLLMSHQFSTAKHLLDQIEGSVEQFISGADLSDDVTLAAIYRKPVE